MLAELSRREKEAGIKPDPDIDVFMKVREEAITFVKLILGGEKHHARLIWNKNNNVSIFLLQCVDLR
jgi:hypothetical protein